ncbi:MAG: hypothetical protein AB7I27_16170 [Bacteriovoracaceae bacterium]
MNIVFFLLYILFLGLKSNVYATSSTDKWYDRAECEFSTAWDKDKVPEWLKTEDVIKQLHPAPLINLPNKKEISCGVRLRLWKNSEYIAIYKTSTVIPSGFGGYKNLNNDIYLGLVIKEEKGTKFIAKTGKPLSLVLDEDLDRLDLAKYQLNESEVAMGVRTLRRSTYIGGGGSNEYLYLFRVSSGDFKQIFYSLMSSEALVGGEWKEDGTRAKIEVGQKPAVINVLKEKTNGFFNLEKKAGKAIMIFKYDGKMYSSTDKEIIQDKNLEED